MNKYKVSICRVEKTIHYFEINANNESEAEDLANELFDESDLDNGILVQGESFTNDIEKIK